MNEAYEAFTVLHAVAPNADFYGIRTVRFLDGHIEIDCGYLQVGLPADGPAEVTFPSRDVQGKDGTMRARVTANGWKLRIDSSSERKGTLFTYVGNLDRRAANVIEFAYADEPLVYTKLVDL